MKIPQALFTSKRKEEKRLIRKRKFDKEKELIKRRKENVQKKRL